jgi:hypothetical protein
MAAPGMRPPVRRPVAGKIQWEKAVALKHYLMKKNMCSHKRVSAELLAELPLRVEKKWGT